MREWNQELVGGPEALALLPKTAGGGIDWGGAKVAQLDTGFRRHPALGFPESGPSSFFCDEEGADCLQPSRGTAEDPLKKMKTMTPGHGTRTATALAGDGIDFQGIAPRLPIVPFRVTNHSLIFDDAAGALAKALNLITARVREGSLSPIVNISLGRPFGDEGLGRAVDRAYEAGVIVVCAAGQLIDRVVYPGKHARTIAVGGLERLGRGGMKLYERYNSYARIDAWAPAEPIRRGDVEGRPYATGDGTSYACLHVTAAAAMWWRLKEDEIRTAYPEPWQRIEAFRHLLLRKPSRMAPDQDAAMRLRQSEVKHLAERSNRGRLVNCLRLLETDLPDPDYLQKRMDLAADDWG